MEGAVGTEGQLAMEAFLDEVDEAFAEGAEVYLLQHFVAEGVEEHGACGALGDAA